MRNAAQTKAQLLSDGQLKYPEAQLGATTTGSVRQRHGMFIDVEERSGNE